MLGAARGDLRISQHVHALGERHAPRIGLDAGLELIDEAVAFQEQRRHAEGQVELRRRHPARLVLPADVIRRDLRAVHHDARDIGGAEAVRGLQRAQRVERGVVAADAGVELERHAHRLPRAAEARGQFLEMKAIG